jgi:predicted transcriptional regulator
MLTNTNKKIKSGAGNRSWLYATIKTLGLQKLCVEKFGKPFTQCSNDVLAQLITEYNSANSAPESTECVDHVAREAITALVNALINYESIYADDAEGILEILKGNVTITSSHNTASPYSNEELDEMFEGYNC